MINMSKFDIHHVDTSCEGETDKESSENKEEVTKVKLNQEVHTWAADHFSTLNDISLKWYISTPYLEIHSPPPDTV